MSLVRGWGEGQQIGKNFFAFLDELDHLFSSKNISNFIDALPKHSTMMSAKLGPTQTDYDDKRNEAS